MAKGFTIDQTFREKEKLAYVGPSRTGREVECGRMKEEPDAAINFFLTSWFESLAVASPRISHPLDGANHVVYAASHPLQPDSFLPRDGENAVRRVEASTR